MLNTTSNIVEQDDEYKEGEQRLLCSNKVNNGALSLSVETGKISVTEDEALDYLAGILAEIFISNEYEQWRQDKSSDILSRIHKRTSRRGK